MKATNEALDAGILATKPGNTADDVAQKFWGVLDKYGIKKGLPNAKFKDAERLVNWVRVVKSNAEISLMQSAARITEKGMKTAFKIINPGVRQCDAVGEIQKALFNGTPNFGGDYASIATLLPTGKGTSASHLTATEDKFVKGEATIIEISGVHKRYHCPMARTVL